MEGFKGQTAGCLRPFVLQGLPSQAPNPDFVVSGILNPVAAGNYFEAEQWEGFPTYKHETLNFWLWMLDGADWILSDNVGELTGGYWNKTNTDIDGDYAATAPNTGTATVTAYGA